MSTILVTGGAGFIGAHACAALVADGHDVVAVDPLRTYAYSFEAHHWHALRYRREVLLQDARVVVASTENRDELRRAVLDARPDYILHLGALPLATVARVSADHAFESILRGTFNLVELALELGTVEKLLYVSSSMVYGDFTKSPMPETERTAPKDPYGGFKLAGEVIVETFSRAQGLPYAIVRPSAVYGPTDMNDRIVQRFVECALWNRPLTIVDPDGTSLDFSYVKDVAQGLVKVLLSPVQNETFNITAGRGRTLTDLHELLRARYPDMPVEVSTKTEDFRPKRGALDIAKARKLLDYEPQYSLERGVDAYLDFLSALSAGPPVIAAPPA
ncbi:MAG TPA: NAD(P)-dependent oxidoreductase [Gaiellaceae bacterium]|nr:NAD(P)-dependent oxidoreductase [Gaiellaceae bacterium]